MKRVSLLTVVLLSAVGACQGGPAAPTRVAIRERAAPATAPVSARRGLNTNAEAAVARCIAAFRDYGKQPPGERAAFVAAECSDIYVEASCREAWVKVGEQRANPAGMPPFIANAHAACLAVYCRILDKPRPRLCTTDLSALPSEARAELFNDLENAIGDRDLGPALRQKLGSARSAFQEELAKTLAPSAANELPPVPLIRVTATELAVWSVWSDEAQPPMLALKRSAGSSPEFDYAALNDALARIVDERWPETAKRPRSTQQIVLKASSALPSRVVLTIMEAARNRRQANGKGAKRGDPLFPDVLFSQTP